MMKRPPPPKSSMFYTNSYPSVCQSSTGKRVRLYSRLTQCRQP